MLRSHLVRVGAFGQIGRFVAGDATRYPRSARVVLRTHRGLEIGEVLAPPADLADDGASDGAIVRGMTVEDELLQARLDKNRTAAHEACAARLEQLHLPTALMDVEHLFDGQTLIFYFLGPSTPELEPLVAELAELYDAQVQFRAFAETVTQGCGPGCGTSEASGGGCSSCATGCAVAGACSTKRNGRPTAANPRHDH
jgi:cell fate regulator YaaT (PSP1 superfamily)